MVATTFMGNIFGLPVRYYKASMDFLSTNLTSPSVRNPAGFSLSRLLSYGYHAMAIEVVGDTGLWVKKVNAMQLIQAFGTESDYSIGLLNH